MSASTALEIVRMVSSGVGAVLAFFLLVTSWRERNRLRDREAATKDELLQGIADDAGADSMLARSLVFLIIQGCMFLVAREAYGSPDTTAVISDLALKSNLGQILVTALITVLTLWDGRDLVARARIVRLESFIPARRAGKKTARRQDIVHVED